MGKFGNKEKSDIEIEIPESEDKLIAAEWERPMAFTKKEGDDAPDQAAKADAGKPELSLVPSAIIYAIAQIRMYGNRKYPEGGKDNWKNVEPDRYRNAMYRHLLAYIDDPYGVDEESGYPHLWHLSCNAAFLCELDKEK